MNKACISALFAVGVFASGMVPASLNADIRVVTSIKPVQSLVAAVMGNVGTPELLIEGANSPHAYALRPSQARSLQNADAVFWIGPGLETFLVKPVETTAQKAMSVPLIDSEGLIKKSYRGDHDHDHGGHADHDGKKDHDDHKDGHKHDHDKKAHDEHDHAKKGHDDHKDGHHAHDEGGIDPHIWLDPENAKVMVRTIAAALSKIDPANANVFKKNADATQLQLDQLTAKLKATIAPVKGKKYIVFHDAYQYFEARFGMETSGAIAVNPEVIPGAEHLKEIKDRVAELGVVCVFSEPQFKPKLVSLVIEGTSAKSSVLDPLGAGITAGPGQYFELMNDMASSIKSCLS